MYAVLTVICAIWSCPGKAAIGTPFTAFCISDTGSSACGRCCGGNIISKLGILAASKIVLWSACIL